MIIKNKKNKRGWVRIVEASVAILLIISVFLIVLSEQNTQKKDIALKIYEEELSILREIQLNQSLRTEVLNLNNLPVKDGEADFPSNVSDKIGSRTPNNLICRANICEMNDVCELIHPPNKDIYVQSVLITVSPTQETKFSPRQLKLFCWQK